MIVINLKKAHVFFLMGIPALAIIVLSLFASGSSYAAPPDSKYTPGETLEPDCSPGAANCSVVAPAVSGENGDITTLTGTEQIIIDANNTEALLVRKDGDAGDVFAVDTTNSKLTINQSQVDHDRTVSDSLVNYHNIDSQLNIETTTNSSKIYRAAYMNANYNSDDQLTSPSAVQGLLAQVNNQGGGTVSKVTGVVSTLVSLSSSITTEGVGVLLGHFNSSATFTNYFGIRFDDPTASLRASNIYAFDFETPFVENATGIRTGYNTAIRYLPLSQASDGITYDSTDLELATTTSGDVLITPAGKAKINDVMNLVPRSSAPSSPELGDVYVDSDSNEFCFYDGSSWTGLKAAGACS